MGNGTSPVVTKRGVMCGNRVVTQLGICMGVRHLVCLKKKKKASGISLKQSNSVLLFVSVAQRSFLWNLLLEFV